MTDDLDESQMFKEDNRIASFQSWPQTAHVLPAMLAAAGFFYTGQADEVKCFSCKGMVLSWAEGDIPMTEHRRHFPECHFVTNPSSSGNVPREAGTEFSSEGTRGQTQSWLPNLERGIRDMNIQPHRPDLIVPSPAISQGTAAGKQAVQGNPISNLPNVSFTSNPVPFNREEMRFEQKRLDTLDHWPKKDRIEPKLASSTGLFFVGQDDKLKCAFCNGAMMNWDTGDNPQEEHFKYFGDRCPLVKGEPTDNVPIDPDNKGAKSTYELLNIVTERPKYPDYAVLAVRETSYKNWPKKDIQHFKKLAEAGFYYTGQSPYMYTRLYLLSVKFQCCYIAVFTKMEAAPSLYFNTKSVLIASFNSK